MSKLQQFREAERMLAEQMAIFESLKNDPQVKKSMQFEDDLKKLMEKYEQTPASVIRILYPGTEIAEAPKTRKPRKLKRYVHPDTGETIETKGGNHKRLKEWKSEFGDEMVEAWVV